VWLGEVDGDVEGDVEEVWLGEVLGEVEELALGDVDGDGLVLGDVEGEVLGDVDGDVDGELVAPPAKYSNAPISQASPTPPLDVPIMSTVTPVRTRAAPTRTLSLAGVKL